MENLLTPPIERELSWDELLAMHCLRGCKILVNWQGRFFNAELDRFTREEDGAIHVAVRNVHIDSALTHTHPPKYELPDLRFEPTMPPRQKASDDSIFLKIERPVPATLVLYPNGRTRRVILARIFPPRFTQIPYSRKTL